MTFPIRLVAIFAIYTASVTCVSRTPGPARAATSQQPASEILVTVRDIMGTPLPGVQTWLCPREGPARLMAVTNAFGVARFVAVPGGTYSAHAALYGFRERPESALVQAGSIAASVAITLEYWLDPSDVVIPGEPRYPASPPPTPSPFPCRSTA